MVVKHLRKQHSYGIIQIIHLQSHFTLNKLHRLYETMTIKRVFYSTCWCRSIRCLRNIIHWNLITTFILRNVMWFLLQLIDHNIHESNEVTALIYSIECMKPLEHLNNLQTVLYQEKYK